MKKLVMTVAVLTCAASIVSAQTVTSANIVGYNKDIGVPGLHISGYQFEGSDTSPSGVFGDQLSLGTTVWAFNGFGYDVSSYESYYDWGIFQQVTNWNPNTLDLSGVAGFWVQNNGVATETAILSGEVLGDDSVTNSILTGLQMVSYPYPVSRNVMELGFDPELGDTVWAYNGMGYDISTYESYYDWGIFQQVTNWNPNTVDIAVGEGFWYEAVAPSTWIVDRPFTP